MSAICFRIIQLLLLPTAVIGYVFFVLKLATYSRNFGTSATILASLYTRYMQHRLGTRRDDACAKLMAAMPNVPNLPLFLVTAPTLLAHRLTRYVPPIYRYPYDGVPPIMHQPAARTTFHDAALLRHRTGVDQFVFLGAGFETRLYTMGLCTAGRCFEVDQPRTQAFKREMLKKAGIDTSGVTYVSADFLVEDWLFKLTEAGFDPDRPTFFLWESVTMYLNREAVESTLRKIATTAAGSVVAFDYFSIELMQSPSLFMRYAHAVLNYIGEPFGTFGIDTAPPRRDRVASFLAECGLAIDEHRDFREEGASKYPRAGFVTAVVPGRS